MAGERELARLLATLTVARADGDFRYEALAADAMPPDDAVVLVRETEGWTAIRPWRAGEPRPEFVTAWLTLAVHSDLAAVGLTAAVAGALAVEGIACNVVAGYYHDHLFVPAERADDALAALARLAERSAGAG